MRVIRPTDLDSTDLYFDDGSSVRTDHYQNCCEHNYADWTSLDDTGFWETDFKEIEIDSWSGGFRINGYSVNCYSEQNGYYSYDLEVYYVSNDNTVLQSLTSDCELI